ncbi:MAG: hypothetical protein AAF251_05350 [Pseudomonadota bacterium]
MPNSSLPDSYRNPFFSAMERLTAVMHRGGSFQPALAEILIEEAARNAARRKPPELGSAVPVDGPKGPAPRSGGAAAPLDFDQA